MPELARTLAESDPSAPALIEFGRASDGAGWEPGLFTLGEIGYLDEDGYVYITDRASDMVVSGGVNLYPAEAELAAWLRERLSHYKCPRSYELVAELPRTTMGKINKRRLRDAYLAGELTPVPVSQSHH